MEAIFTFTLQPLTKYDKLEEIFAGATANLVTWDPLLLNLLPMAQIIVYSI